MLYFSIVIAMHVFIPECLYLHFSSIFPAGTSDLKYEWVLLERPDSDDTGSVSDLHSQTITLMHLTQGVYVFKVEVTAVGAHGEAVGNVTVKPGEYSFHFINFPFFDMQCSVTYNKINVVFFMKFSNKN